MGEINLLFVLGAAFIAAASPGPATLGIAGTSMASGRRAGLALASGITTGSVIWSVTAASGLGALMLANSWVLEVIRYIGAAYLIYLACKSARSALSSSKEMKPRDLAQASLRRAYVRGLTLHLTNPKAVLFFGSLYAIVLPSDATPSALATMMLAIALQSFLIFHGYALLFSSAVMVRFYMRLRRWVEAAFSVAFGAAGVAILTSRFP